MEAYGFAPDGWQEDVVSAWLARRADDSPAYLTCGLAVPRQNGKNGCIEVFEFYKLLVCGERILHTAHQVKTANKSFQRLAALFSDPAHPEVCAMVANIRRTNGEQGIYLTNGAYVEYSARSRGASRGNTYSVVVYDEAQELTDEQVEALMPTLAASPTGYRQLVYTGTPPGPGSPGTVFRRLRDACAGGAPPRNTCWHEWSVEGLPPEGAAFDAVRDDVWATNPAMGLRLSEEFTEGEFASMSADGFARERLGWWAPAEGAGAPKIGAEAWDRLAADPAEAPAADKTAFGVKFSPDGSEVALCACDLCGDVALVGLVGTASLADGTAWLAEYLDSKGGPDEVAAVAVDGLRGKDALLNRLRAAWPRQALMDPGTRGVVAACSMLAEAVGSGALLHLSGEGQGPLDLSAKTSVERPVGRDGGWAFGGDSPTCIEAAALALWAAKTTRRDPGGGCVVL